MCEPKRKEEKGYGGRHAPFRSMPQKPVVTPQNTFAESAPANSWSGTRGVIAPLWKVPELKEQLEAKLDLPPSPVEFQNFTRDYHVATKSGQHVNVLRVL